MANTVSYLYEILDRYSAPLRKIGKVTKRFASQARRAQQGVQKLSKKMDGLASRSQNLQGALGALGLGAGLKKVIDVSTDMEDAMSDVGRVTDVTASGLLQFEDTLERISEELGKSKRGLAEMAFEGGKLGIPIEKMEEFLMMTSRTAIAFDMVDQEAGRAIGSIQAKMGLMGEDAGKLLDSMNFLADTTSANGARMIQIIERLSGTFKVLELPPAVAAAFAAFADQIEVTPELAASGMQMMIRQMRKMPGMTTKLMADPIGTVNKLLERMTKMGPELRTKFMEKMFGAEASRFVEKAVGNFKLFGSTVEKALSAEAAGSMQRELENQMKRSSKTFQRFSVTVTNTFDTIGDVIKPFAVTVAKVLTDILIVVRDFAKENPKLIKFGAAIATITVVFTGLAVTVGLLMAALSPLVLFFATFALPIVGIVAGVTTLVIAFKKWVEASHPVIDVLRDIASDVGAIFSPLGKLLGIVGDVGEGFNGLNLFVDALGSAIIVILAPLRILLKTMRGIVGAGSAILKGDFKGAFKFIKEAGSGILDVGKQTAEAVGFRFDKDKALGDAVAASLAVSGLGKAANANVVGMDNANVVGMDNATAAATKNKDQKISVSGDIGVSANNGAKIDNADINLNGGANVANGR